MGAEKGAPDEGEHFSRSVRIRRRKDFLRVQQQGVRVSVDPLIALALKNSQSVTRLGITVSSKVGNAVLRNRIRRRLREIFRKRRTAFPRGLDLVLIATTRARLADSGSLERACLGVSERLQRRFP